MSYRGGSRVREGEVDRKNLHPIWRGVGCIFLLLLTVGGFMLGNYLLEIGFFQQVMKMPIPRGYRWYPIEGLPGVPLVQLGAMVVVDILGFSLITLIWSFLNPPKLGKYDAPPPQRKIKSKRR